MKRPGLLLTVVLATVAVTTALYIRARPKTTLAASQPGSTAMQPVSPRQSISSTVPQGVQPGTHAAQSSNHNYRALFDRSHDDWELAHALLPMARNNNADAQYYLYAVLHRCASDNKMYFQKRGRILTLDEGIEFAEQRALSLDLARSVYERCHRFQEQNADDLGNADDWLVRAARAGQPVAQAAVAARLFLDKALQGLQQAGAAVNPDAPPALGVNEEPRELLRTALRSKDPEVLFDIGSDQALLNPNVDNAKVNQLAWWLVACERGFGCAPTSDWVRAACTNDMRCALTNDPGELIRSLAGNDWAQVRSLAEQVSGKLDAGDWDGLVPPA